MKGSFVSRGVMVASSLCLLALSGMAQEEAEAAAAGRWRVAVGLRGRQVSADFHQSSPDMMPGWETHVRRQRSTGSAALFDGSSPGEVYEDGWIANDPDWTGVDGTTRYFGFDTAPQLIAGGPSGQQVAFHSTRYSYTSELSQTPGAGSDKENGVWPSISVDWLLCRRGDKHVVRLVGRYGVGMSELGSGWQETARQQVGERRERHEFVYNVDPLGEPVPTAPFNNTAPPLWVWVIADGAQYGTAYPGSMDAPAGPVKNETVSRRTVAEFVAHSLSELDVVLHEVFLGISWESRLSDRVTVFCSAGPTLNLIDWDLDHQTVWSLGDGGMSVLATRERDSGDDVEIGASAEVGASISLDDEGRFFAGINGGGCWIDDIEVGTAGARTTIKGSSLTAGLHAGMNL